MAVAIWDKEKLLFDRDASGKLIPKKVRVEGIPEETYITIIPLLRGEIKKVRQGLDAEGNTTKDQELDIIKEHCVDPKFMDDELPFVKKYVVDAIITTVLKYSGLTVEDDTVRKAIDTLESDVKKNSTNPEDTRGSAT